MKNPIEVGARDKRESWAQINRELSEPGSAAAVARSLSQFPAVASWLNPCRERGALFRMQEGCASGTCSLPALLPTPATAAPASSQWIFRFSPGVLPAHAVPAGCSLCWSCQEPVLGECWSCSSFPGACTFSCLLVTSSSLPAPGIPSGYRSPALDDCGCPGGSFFSPLSTGCHFQLQQAPGRTLQPLSGAIPEPGWEQPFPLLGPEGTGAGGDRWPRCSVSTEPG